jgi:hypothetical protein
MGAAQVRVPDYFGLRVMRQTVCRQGWTRTLSDKVWRSSYG